MAEVGLVRFEGSLAAVAKEGESPQKQKTATKNVFPSQNRSNEWSRDGGKADACCGIFVGLCKSIGFCIEMSFAMLPCCL